MPNLFSIENKIVLISGAGRGIGRHLAHSMAKHSAFVYCIDKKFPKEVPKDVKKNMFNVKCDITNNRSFTKVCQNIFKTHKKIDVLVNNAAILGPIGHIEKINWNEWVKTIQINLLGSVLLCRTVVPYFKKRNKGKIIQLSGGGAASPLPFISSYAVSKAAIVRFIENLSEEVKKYL